MSNAAPLNPTLTSHRIYVRRNLNENALSGSLPSQLGAITKLERL